MSNLPYDPKDNLIKDADVLLARCQDIITQQQTRLTEAQSALEAERTAREQAERERDEALNTPRPDLDLLHPMRTVDIPDWTRYNHPAQLKIREIARQVNAANAVIELNRDRITDLERQLADVTRERDDARKRIEPISPSGDDYVDELESSIGFLRHDLTTARAEADALREALEPFLRAPHIGSNGPRTSTIVVQEYYFTDARKALAATQQAISEPQEEAKGDMLCNECSTCNYFRPDTDQGPCIAEEEEIPENCTYQQLQPASEPQQDAEESNDDL